MKLDFYQSPDWASILEKSYKPINRGFERRELAERENDKRRIENAGKTLELLQAAAKFGGQAKKFSNAMYKKHLEDQMAGAAMFDGVDEATIKKWQRSDEVIKRDFFIRNKQAAEAEREGDDVLATELKQAAYYRRYELGFKINGMRRDASNLGASLRTGDYAEQYKKAKDQASLDAVLSARKADLVKSYTDRGLSKDLINRHFIPGYNKFRAIESNRLAQEQVTLLAQKEAQDTMATFQQSWETYQDNPIEFGKEMWKWVEGNYPSHGAGKVRDGVDAVLSYMKKLEDNGLISGEARRAFMKHEIPAKDKDNKLTPLSKQYPGAFLGSEQAADDATIKYIDEKEESSTSRLGEYRIVFDEQLEKDGGILTAAAEEQWWGMIQEDKGISAQDKVEKPDWLKDLVNTQERDDLDDQAYLNQLIAFGGITQNDVSGMSIATRKWAQPFIANTAKLQAAGGKTLLSASNKLIDGWTNKLYKTSFGKNDTASPEWILANEAAKADFNAILNDLLAIDTPIDGAIQLARKEVEANFKLDELTPLTVSKYAQRSTVSKEDFKEIRRAIKLGSRELTGKSKEAQLAYLENTKLPGSESYLEQGRLYQKGIIDELPHYYKRLGNEHLTGWDILDAQLKADGVKEGLGIRPPVEDALDAEELAHIRRKLRIKPTTNSIEQSKVDVQDVEKYSDLMNTFLNNYTEEELEKIKLYSLWNSLSPEVTLPALLESLPGIYSTSPGAV